MARCKKEYRHGFEDFLAAKEDEMRLTEYNHHEGIVRDSHRIANEIWEIENANLNKQREWLSMDRGVYAWHLCDGRITLEKSDDCMMWYLWQIPTDQSRHFWKCVPMAHLSKREIAKILEAQPWVCI